MDYFRYRDRVLHCEDVPVRELARQYGTPLYIYDEATVRQRASEYVAAMGSASSETWSWGSSAP